MAYNNATNTNVSGIVNADGAGGFNGNNLAATGNTISSTDTNGDIILAPDGTGAVSVTAAPIVPSGDRAESLGSATNSWDNLYADGLSFNDGTDIMHQYSYETFQAVVSFGGGSTGITYSTRSGRLIKIGKLAYVEVDIVLSSKGTDTGNILITGMSTLALRFTALSLSGANNTFSGTIQARINTSGIEIVSVLSGGVSTILTDASCSNGSVFRVAGCFEVA